jgi:hypothetical protein
VNDCSADCFALVTAEKLCELVDYAVLFVGDSDGYTSIEDFLSAVLLEDLDFHKVGLE